MDKGLDIATRRALLALHAAAYADRRVLAELCGDESTLGAAVTAGLRRLSRHRLAPGWELADRALAWAQTTNHHILLFGDRAYPACLRTIPTPPPVLFIDGDLAQVSSPQVALVGSRQGSPSGCGIAHALASALAKLGVTVTSGLARGIDGAAHRGSLAAGGATIAVLGCAIDHIYPSQHRGLAGDIRDRGALVSEFPFGASPRPAHFPQRNRIISGLASGTVVIEAALRSGSISTAFHALEQGREVFAVPGSIHSYLSKGCHALIKQGARLTEDISDIIEELPQLQRLLPAAKPAVGALVSAAVGAQIAGVDPRLLAACGWDLFTPNEIVARSGLTVQEVSSMLLTLELAGVIQVQATGSYLRIR